VPSKGLYTQTVCVLLTHPASIHTVEEALREFKIGERQSASDQWAFRGESITLPFRVEVNGHVTVDTIARAWPDSMGDPSRDPTTFGAWAMSNFGPHTQPGALARASEQCWGWEEGKEMPRQHQAFLRIRTSYVLEMADEEAPLIPEDYDALRELDFITIVARALLDVPGALCYFNPNGETLLCTADLDALLRRQLLSKTLPLEAWTNIRPLAGGARGRSFVEGLARR